MDATTGTPADIASSAGRPKPSSSDGMHEQPCDRIERLALVIGDVAEVRHVAGERRTGDRVEPRRGRRRGAAGEHQSTAVEARRSRRRA